MLHIFNTLKNKMNIEHTRYRSPISFVANVYSAFIAYIFYKHQKLEPISKFNKTLIQN